MYEILCQQALLPLVFAIFMLIPLAISITVVSEKYPNQNIVWIFGLVVMFIVIEASGAFGLFSVKYEFNRRMEFREYENLPINIFIIFTIVVVSIIAILISLYCILSEKNKNKRKAT